MIGQLTIRERVALTILASLLVAIVIRHTLAYGWHAAVVMAVIIVVVWAIVPRIGGNR